MSKTLSKRNRPQPPTRRSRVTRGRASPAQSVPCLPQAASRRRTQQHVRRHSISDGGLRRSIGKRRFASCASGSISNGRGGSTLGRGVHATVTSGRPPLAGGRAIFEVAPVTANARNDLRAGTTLALSGAAGFPISVEASYEDQHRRGVAACRSLARRAGARAAGRGRRGAPERSGRRPSHDRRRVLHLPPSRGVPPSPGARHRRRAGLRPGHRREDWRQRGYRQLVVYYRDGRYYDRTVRDRPAMREVVVYERDGRYYRSATSANGTTGTRVLTGTGTTAIGLTCPRAFRRLIT